MPGFMDGFMKGYGFVDNLQTRNEERARARENQQWVRDDRERAAGLRDRSTAAQQFLLGRSKYGSDEEFVQSPDFVRYVNAHEKDLLNGDTGYDHRLKGWAKTDNGRLVPVVDRMDPNTGEVVSADVPITDQRTSDPNDPMTQLTPQEILGTLDSRFADVPGYAKARSGQFQKARVDQAKTDWVDSALTPGPARGAPQQTIPVVARAGGQPQQQPRPAELGSFEAKAAPGGTYVAGKAPGLLQQGNLDLAKRPILHNKDGSISTVRSITITNGDGQAILLPTVGPNGEDWTPQQAVEHYRKTRQNLGVFKDEPSANAYAQQLHEQQAQMYADQPAALSPERQARIAELEAERAKYQDVLDNYDPTKADLLGTPDLTRKEDAKYRLKQLDQEIAAVRSGDQPVTARDYGRKARELDAKAGAVLQDWFSNNALAQGSHEVIDGVTNFVKGAADFVGGYFGDPGKAPEGKVPAGPGKPRSQLTADEKRTTTRLKRENVRLRDSSPAGRQQAAAESFAAVSQLQADRPMSNKQVKALLKLHLLDPNAVPFETVMQAATKRRLGEDDLKILSDQMGGAMVFRNGQLAAHYQNAAYQNANAASAAGKAEDRRLKTARLRNQLKNEVVDTIFPDKKKQAGMRSTLMPQVDTTISSLNLDVADPNTRSVLMRAAQMMRQYKEENDGFLGIGADDRRFPSLTPFVLAQRLNVDPTTMIKGVIDPAQEAFGRTMTDEQQVKFVGMVGQLMSRGYDAQEAAQVLSQRIAARMEQ